MNCYAWKIPEGCYASAVDQAPCPTPSWWWIAAAVGAALLLVGGKKKPARPAKSRKA